MIASAAENADGDYVVVFRARSPARFLPEEGYEVHVNGPNLGPGGARVRASTRWVKERGSEFPRELLIEVWGRAGSLDAAGKTFSGLASPLATLIAFVANVGCEPLEVILAYDRTPTSSERAFLEVFVPDETGAVGEGRIIRPELVTAAHKAFLSMDVDFSRVDRALRHYELALRHWYVGGEWLALNHLWIAAENLTKALVRRIVTERGISEAELAVEYDIVTDDPRRTRWKELLNARVREVVLFDGDSDTYQTARSASDGIEHGYWELDKIAEHALRCADLTFNYVRRAITSLLELPGDLSGQLVAIEPLDVASRRRIVRGSLVGVASDPAPLGEPHPRLEWRPAIDEVIRTGSSFQAKGMERLTVRTHPDVGFRLERMEVHGRVRKGQAAVDLADEGVSIDTNSPAESAELLDGVMPLVDAALAAATGPLRSTPERHACTLAAQAVAYFQGARALIQGPRQPVEALALLHGLVIVAARFEQMSDPAGPGLGIVLRWILDAMESSGADANRIDERRKAVHDQAAALGLTIPETLEDPENTAVHASLRLEMEFAAAAVEGGYEAVVFHSRQVDDHTAAFHVSLESGPFTDLVSTAAVIAMLTVLRQSAAILGWTVDADAVALLLQKAEDLNDAAAQQDLFASKPHHPSESDDGS